MNRCGSINYRTKTTLFTNFIVISWKRIVVAIILSIADSNKYIKIYIQFLLQSKRFFSYQENQSYHKNQFEKLPIKVFQIRHLQSSRLIKNTMAPCFMVILDFDFREPNFVKCLKVTKSNTLTVLQQQQTLEGNYLALFAKAKVF